ncbi:unnamed protein product [Clonostachys chloroleuca]|uniref:Protein kinase domain-containing protein n=1 Tax=Clonostachys chloroleuca TaxID=1926264 RepID=A0AA35M0L4_9HYPO|nr:unnamed protein product [Clonostachys chloroleuca]
MASPENALVQEASQMKDHALPPTTEPSQPFSKDLNLGMFEVNQFSTLAKGKFSRIYLAKDRETGLEYALKTMRKTDLILGRVEEQARGSFKIQSEMDHPNVLRVFGQFEGEHEHESYIYILMELSRKGSLYDLMKQNIGLPEPQAAKLVAQLAKALKYIHGKNILHRDINPENILIGSDGEVKVSGFIWSKPMVDGRCSGLCGLLDYLAPEMLNGAENYDAMIDIWCLGVLTFELLAGKAPFEDGLMMTQKRIKNLDMEVPSFVSAEATDFIHKVAHHSGFANSEWWLTRRQILVLDPRKRLSLEEIQQHPWILKHN